MGRLTRVSLIFAEVPLERGTQSRVCKIAEGSTTGCTISWIKGEAWLATALWGLNCKRTQIDAVSGLFLVNSWDVKVNSFGIAITRFVPSRLSPRCSLGSSRFILHDIDAWLDPDGIWAPRPKEKDLYYSQAFGTHWRELLYQPMLFAV